MRPRAVRAFSHSGARRSPSCFVQPEGHGAASINAAAVSATVSFHGRQLRLIGVFPGSPPPTPLTLARQRGAPTNGTASPSQQHEDRHATPQHNTADGSAAWRPGALFEGGLTRLLVGDNWQAGGAVGTVVRGVAGDGSRVVLFSDRGTETSVNRVLQTAFVQPRQLWRFLKLQRLLLSCCTAGDLKHTLTDMRTQCPDFLRVWLAERAELLCLRALLFLPPPGGAPLNIILPAHLLPATAGHISWLTTSPQGTAFVARNARFLGAFSAFPLRSPQAHTWTVAARAGSVQPSDSSATASAPPLSADPPQLLRASRAAAACAHPAPPPVLSLVRGLNAWGSPFRPEPRPTGPPRVPTLLGSNAGKCGAETDLFERARLLMERGVSLWPVFWVAFVAVPLYLTVHVVTALQVAWEQRKQPAEESIEFKAAAAVRAWLEENVPDQAPKPNAS